MTANGMVRPYSCPNRRVMLRLGECQTEHRHVQQIDHCSASPTAGLLPHTDQARRHGGEPRFDLAARPLLPQHDRAVSIEADDLEEFLPISTPHDGRAGRRLDWPIRKSPTGALKSTVAPISAQAPSSSTTILGFVDLRGLTNLKNIPAQVLLGTNAARTRSAVTETHSGGVEQRVGDRRRSSHHLVAGTVARSRRARTRSKR